ncbi:ATP-binding cassette domain-containing protein [Lactiplantibacillus plantarum]|nr:ATP-binding cassette domain-containing protein [Lactiplantibacillus plantarum]
MVAIKLHELSKSFQGPVINQLSLTIPDQQITALIGPSGSGKSTLLNMIAGLTTPDSGQISFDNQPIFDAATHWNQPPAQRHLAMVFQDFAPVAAHDGPRKCRFRFRKAPDQARIDCSSQLGPRTS